MKSLRHIFLGSVCAVEARVGMAVGGEDWSLMSVPCNMRETSSSTWMVVRLFVFLISLFPGSITTQTRICVNMRCLFLARLKLITK